MNIQITARHYHASAQLHSNLVESLEKLGRFNDSITGVHVILDAGQAGVGRAESVIQVHDKSLVARAEEGSMGKAIESMLDKAERLLKKENEKLKVVHKAESVLSVAMAPA
jgi:ribosomal subunit interface protein